MSASSPVAQTNPGNPAKWALPTLLVAAGALGNYFKYPLFFEIDFLFGSIFSFLILQFYGRTYGIGAALLVSGVTYFIWGHPYAVVIMTVELAFVALITGRYKVSLVFADAMYWVFLGMPMVYLFYHGVMGVPDGSVTITMTKQAVNGITNVLLARLLFMLIGFRTGKMDITLREILHTCMVLCVALPMLILIIVDSRSDFEKGIARSQVELKNAALKINNTIQIWIENRAAGLASLASVAKLGDASKTQAALDLMRNADSQLLRVGFLSPAFVTTHYSPLVNEQGRSNIGIDFSDRTFAPQLRAQPKPMLSEIMAPRLGSNVPIVAYVHPVLMDNQVKGYLSGVLSLDQLSQVVAREANASAMRFTLLDKGAKVIVSNRADQKTFTPFALGEGSFNKIDDSISQWVPKIRANAPFYERFRNSYYVNDSVIAGFSDWRLVLEQPVGPMQKALSATYTQRLILLLILLLLGTLLAELVSRQVLKTFEALREVTGDLPARLASSKTIEWPASQMSETQSLIANFQSMAASLQAEFAATHSANALLEDRVALRTNELSQSEAALKNSLDEKDALLKEVHHRVKNNLQVVTSLLRLEARRSTAPEAVNVLKAMQGRIQAMAQLHESLYRSGTFASIDLGLYLGQIAGQTFRTHLHDDQPVQLKLNMGTVLVGMDQAVGCGLLVNELVTNSLKHAFGHARPGEVRVELQPVHPENVQRDAMWNLRVVDTGTGLGPDFEAKRGHSLGMQLVDDLSHQVGGTLAIHSWPGEGSEFAVIFKALEPMPLVMPA